MPAPDVSGPASLGEVFKMFTPAGTDPDALMAALKGARMQPVHAGTLCAGCQARGVATLHSPAGDEHRAWERAWAQDPDWWPAGVDRLEPRRWDYPMGGLPSVPLSELGKAARQAEGMRSCIYCQRTEPANAACPNDASLKPESSLPADPSPVDLMAGIAINDMIEAMVAGGRPLESAERIVGAMLAAHGLLAEGRDQ